MASKRRVKKKRIKEDQLVTYTVKASQIVQQYFTQVVVGVVVLVVAIAVILFVAHTRRTAARESERELARAMSEYNIRDVETASVSFSQLAERYGGQPAGEVSRYFLAKSLFAQARYEEALNAFDVYLDKADGESRFTEAAIIGKAMCYEGVGNFASAAELLEQLSQTIDPDDPRYVDVLFQTARNYEKAENRDKALEFYRQVTEKATGELKERASVM
ncbi:MAG: tetratricopeptide repeat protein, partial [Candidatus Latescibacterota bacterium]